MHVVPPGVEFKPVTAQTSTTTRRFAVRPRGSPRGPLPRGYQADAPDLRLLPGERRRRRERSGAECEHDSAALDHSITRVACTSIDCGIFLPSALAVFRLTTISNRVARSIGISPGLAPLNILSTKFAARRNISK